MKLDGKTGISIFALVALVSGCAVAPDVHEQAAGIASKTSCCASEQTLPNAAPVAKEQEISLQANSPHYDFGTGLAPFARLSLAPTTTELQIRAHPAGSGRLFGGDGLVHYANFTPIFYDASGSRLPSKLSEHAINPFGLAGFYMYFADAEVPAGARTVVITTRIDTVGQTVQEFTMGSTMIKAGAAFIPVGGGTGTFKIALAPYGDLTVVANGL